MTSVGRRLALALGFTAALWLGSSGTGMAQPEDANVARARELFQRGVEAYDRGVYFEALQSFQEAYTLRPHPSVRVNIANCYDKLDRPAEAIQNFEQFLGSGSGSGKQQEEIVLALEQLRKRVGRLSLHVTPDGAKIVIDNTNEYRAPLTEPLLLKVGRHPVNISLDGFETAIRVVDIHAETSTDLSVALLRLDSPVPPLAALSTPQPTAAPPQPLPAPAAVPLDAGDEAGSGLPATVWVAGGVTVAALLTSIVTGQLALAADREFNGELAAVRNMQLSNIERAAAWSNGMRAADRAQVFAITTDVLLSAAVVGTVLTTVLYLNHRSSDPELQASEGALRLQF